MAKKEKGKLEIVPAFESFQEALDYWAKKKARKYPYFVQFLDKFYKPKLKLKQV